jgi:hypothetical protein
LLHSDPIRFIDASGELICSISFVNDFGRGGLYLEKGQKYSIGQSVAQE